MNTNRFCFFKLVSLFLFCLFISSLGNIASKLSERKMKTRQLIRYAENISSFWSNRLSDMFQNRTTNTAFSHLSAPFCTIFHSKIVNAVHHIGRDLTFYSLSENSLKIGVHLERYKIYMVLLKMLRNIQEKNNIQKIAINLQNPLIFYNFLNRDNF